MSRDCYPPFSNNESHQISSSERKRYIPDDGRSENDSARSSHMHLNSYNERYYYHQPHDNPSLPHLVLAHPSLPTSIHPSLPTSIHTSLPTSIHPSVASQNQWQPLNFANEKYAVVSNRYDTGERRFDSSSGYADTNSHAKHSELKSLLLNSRTMENGNSNRNIIVRNNNNSSVSELAVAKNERKTSKNDAFSPISYKKNYAISEARQNEAYNLNTDHRGVINNKLSVIKTAPKSIPDNKSVYGNISNDKKACGDKLSTDASEKYSLPREASEKYKFSTEGGGKSTLSTEEGGKSKFSTEGSAKSSLSTEASGRYDISPEGCGKSKLSTELSGKSIFSTEGSGKSVEVSVKLELPTEARPRSVIMKCNSTSKQKVTNNDAQYGNSSSHEDCSSKVNENNNLNFTEQKNGVQSSNDSIEMVENKLAEMFAGLEDSEDLKTPTAPSRSARSNEVTSEEEAEEEDIKPKQKRLQMQKLPKKRGPKKKPLKVVKKKVVAKSKKKNVASKNKDLRTISKEADVIRTRVPIIRVHGSYENPTKVSIINGKPDEGDNSEKPSASYKKFAKLTKRENHHGSLADSVNFGSKLELNSNSPWECVFCKCGPHQLGVAGHPIGPLYGPYYVKNDVENLERKPKTPHASRRSETLKRKASNRSQSTEEDTAESYREIWAHENCIVWASGVYMIGTSLMGLEEAVKEASETVCDYCQKCGASIGCQRRKCSKKSHFDCALNMEWHLDRTSFKTFCNDHKCA